MAERDTAKGGWTELLREGRAAYTILVVGGSAINALQILVIAIIMPTVVADIGGAAYYTWAAMIYTVGSIVGAASVAPVWAALGPRRGYALSAVALLAGTLGCALAPDMATLIVARSVQGFAGGLVSGGGMALVTGLFDARLRTRVLALSQATFTVSHLCGPVVGGMFAAIGWWRGSFWVMVPVVLVFAAVTWLRVPERLEGDADRARTAFPLGRLVTLASGVLCVAAVGPVGEPVLRTVLIAGAIGLVWMAFRIDDRSTAKLFPSRAFSFASPVGLALWILALASLTQTSVTLFLPLLLQVVHSVTPVLISFVTIIISFGWTVGTFVVSGWSGTRERTAMAVGPLLSLVGLAGITVTAFFPHLVALAGCAFLMGVGIGCYNVHLVARTLEAAAPGESRTTAASLSMTRSLGTAFGAAIAGVIAHAAGLGAATDPHAVAAAVSAVYEWTLVPLVVAALCMFRLLRLAPRPAGPLPA